MIVTCDKCERQYDDACRWTICPHGPLGFAHDDYCPNCDVLRSQYGGVCMCAEVLAKTPIAERLKLAQREQPSQTANFARAYGRGPTKIADLADVADPPPKPVFRVGPGGSLIADQEVPGAVHLSKELSRFYTGGARTEAWMLCETASSEVMRRIVASYDGMLVTS